MLAIRFPQDFQVIFRRRDWTWSQKLEVTNNHLKGHVLTIPKRSPAELPGFLFFVGICSHISQKYSIPRLVIYTFQ